MKRFIQTVMVILAIAVLGSVLRAGDITGQGMSQGDLYTFLSNVVTMSNETKSDYNNSRTGLQAMNFSKTGVASNGIKIGIGTTTYSIGGVMYYKATQTVTLNGGLTPQSAQTSCRYVIALNSGGTATATKGTEVTDTTAMGAVTTTFPTMSSSLCPVGYVVVSASDSWGLGTDSWGIATVTFYDLSFIDEGSSISTTDLSLTGL